MYGANPYPYHRTKFYKLYRNIYRNNNLCVNIRLYYNYLQKRCITIDIPHVKEVEFRLMNGTTEPIRCILEDETRVVAKYYNNCQGNLILVNEYICYKMALLLGLKMPHSGICIFDENEQDKENILSSRNYGYGFYSTYFDKNTILKPGIIRFIVNVDLIYKILLFDHVVYNKDRNPGNLLVEFKAKSIYLTVIDHTHVFKNQTLWDEQCFKIGIEEDDYLDSDIMERNDTLYSMFYHYMEIKKDELYKYGEFFQKILTEERLSSIMSQVPNEWGAKKSALDALEKYLLYRLAHINDMCKVIVDYIHR